MTFFTIALFLAIGSLLTMYLATSDPVPIEASIVMGILAVSISILPICVLQWAKAKLSKDPNAFKNE